MNIVLADGEKIVKSWDYGKAKGLIFTRGQYNLTLTNQKLISIYEGKKEAVREDYDLNEIKGISVSYKMKRRFFFFKRGQLSLSFYNAPTCEHVLIGLSAIRRGGFMNFLRNIPIIGILFGGSKTKIKVDVDSAKDIVANLSALIYGSKTAA